MTGPHGLLWFYRTVPARIRDSRASHTTFPGRNCSFPWAPYLVEFLPSQALISQRPSSMSSYRVRHHSCASPDRYIVAIVTWSSKGAQTETTIPYPKSLRSLASRVPTNAFGFAWFEPSSSSHCLRPSVVWGPRPYSLKLATPWKVTQEGYSTDKT